MVLGGVLCSGRVSPLHTVHDDIVICAIRLGISPEAPKWLIPSKRSFSPNDPTVITGLLIGILNMMPSLAYLR